MNHSTLPANLLLPTALLAVFFASFISSCGGGSSSSAFTFNGAGLWRFLGSENLLVVSEMSQMGVIQTTAFRLRDGSNCFDTDPTIELMRLESNRFQTLDVFQNIFAVEVVDDALSFILENDVNQNGSFFLQRVEGLAQMDIPLCEA